MNEHLEALVVTILEEIAKGIDHSRTAQRILEAIGSGKATYADALKYARENGQVMAEVLQRYLPEVLTNGMLFRSEADLVVRRPMEASGERVAKAAAEIQQALNDNAGVGIRAIEPDLNEDQIAGIITDICNAESYDLGKDNLFSQIENFLEGTVDDCVRENADFQAGAGLKPKIVRTAFGKCCDWCSSLAGTYDYEDVKDKGNDVFRRHKNCHCIVSYDPGDGAKRRQNVHTRQWG